jgi:hypothetical protein
MEDFQAEARRKISDLIDLWVLADKFDMAHLQNLAINTIQEGRCHGCTQKYYVNEDSS